MDIKYIIVIMAGLFSVVVGMWLRPKLQNYVSKLQHELMWYKNKWRK